MIREQWVSVMKRRLVHDKLVKCYRVEGVNHKENCKEIADKYWSMLQDPTVKVRGYIGVEKIDNDR